MSRRKNYDIKAPDGYMLGGLRIVRADGTILFQRGWWQAPKEWAGEKVWVHEEGLDIQAAPPGMHIYEAQLQRKAVWCERTDRPDAADVFRNPVRKAWAQRMKAA